MFSNPGELPSELRGDTVTQGLDSILASVSAGNMTGIASLVENEWVKEYVRSAALKGLVTLVACGKRSRDEAMAGRHDNASGGVKGLDIKAPHWRPRLSPALSWTVPPARTGDRAHRAVGLAGRVPQ